MQPATVAVALSGDSGGTLSSSTAACVVSSAAMASTIRRSRTTACSRAGPTGVNRAMLCRSTARAEPYHDENAGGPAKLILDQLLADGVDITDPAALHPGPSRPGSGRVAKQL